MSGTFTKLGIHIVFSTKNRIPLITQILEKELHSYIGGIIKNCNGIPVCINGTEDHIHIYCIMPKNVSLSEFVRRIKSNSSKWVHEKFSERKKFHWQLGYGAFSVGKDEESRLIHYINTQKEHHRRKSYKEEFLDFLRQYNITYDERYIWI